MKGQKAERKQLGRCWRIFFLSRSHLQIHPITHPMDLTRAAALKGIVESLIDCNQVKHEAGRPIILRTSTPSAITVTRPLKISCIFYVIMQIDR